MSAVHDHEHDHVDSGSLRPKAARLESPESALQMRAALSGPLDAVAPPGVLGLQRAAGNATVQRSGGPRPGTAQRTVAGESSNQFALLSGLTAVHLQRAAGNQAVSRLVAQRHPVGATPIHRHTRADLFDPPGTELADFEQSIRRQADWFAEPSLTAADRTDLHFLLRRAAEGPHVLAGVGDVKLTELRGVPGGAWAALDAFGRACHGGSQTVRILDRAPYPLGRRTALGRTLLDLEAVIPPEVLKVTVSEAQLVDVDARGLVPAIAAYWAQFQPHLQGPYEPGPGARATEFQHVLDLVGGPGIAPFASLHGRIRSLHRFTILTLTRLVANFADVSRRRPVHLILHTGHDADSFQTDAPIVEDLVVNSPNLVLILEGRSTLAEMTGLIPALTASHGKRDAIGRPWLGQVMISGHGENRSVEMAGTGAPTVTADGIVEYPNAAAESLDLDQNRVRTEALLDALLTNLDPATARVVFNGCLVGSNPVPPATPAAGVAAHIAANPALATFTHDRGVTLGLRPGFTQAARASTGAPTSLRDAAGNLAIQYPFDPTAFGSALTYVATGHEPTGLFRAAVELAATDPLVAERQLRARLAAGVSAARGWWSECTAALVAVALDGVAPGAGVDVGRLNMMAHLSETPFLAVFSRGITVNSFVTDVNTQPVAAAVYARLAATPTMTGPSDLDEMAGRLIFEQGWLALGGARVGPLLAFLDATAPLTTVLIEQHLDASTIAGHSPALFPAGAAATRGRIRLALAWMNTDPANADVRAFLDAQVLTPPTGAELAPAVRGELGSLTEADVLGLLGRLAPVVPPAGGGGGQALPAANAEVRRAGRNQVLIEPHPYQATVLPQVLNVRTLPGMHGTPFAWPHRGDVLHVAGFTHDWAAVDINGRLGFVHRSKVTPP
ncbi:MAG: hypothetical protein ACRDZS_02705 [Acidimicrobiales bacterium]